MSLVRLTISSGRGPAEVRWFVARLSDALLSEVVERGATLVSRTAHGLPDAPFSVDLVFSWDDPRQALALEGTHELLMASPARGPRSRKRWFASVEVLCEQQSAPQTLRLSDVTFQACRASGAGGQHVNRTESAIRAVHVPTGTTVRIESERSQHQNKQRALAVLARTLERRKDEAEAERGRVRRASAIQVERGKAVASWRVISGSLARV